MLSTPFYDPNKSYDGNYAKGPFGVLADGNVYDGKIIPFGIPAGPLLNSKYIKAAFEKGFDMCVYKTVRSDEYPCHPFPNVLAVHPGNKLVLDGGPLVADKDYAEPISITNSFGVPSRSVKVWQEDARKAISYEKPGQIMIMSCMGTVREGQSRNDFIDDYIKTAKLVMEIKPKMLEINLSCPNIGNEGLVCYNLDVTENIASGIRAIIGNTPLILKVGYYKDQKQLKAMAQIAEKYAQIISAINTIQATIIDNNGKQALPGKMRSRSGVCGASIKWAGLEMTKRLSALRKDLKANYQICGVGGVMTPANYHEYRTTGADIVMSATGAMWNPKLAIEIKEYENGTKNRKSIA